MFLKLWASYCYQPMNLFGLVCKIFEDISCSISNIGEATFLIKLSVNYISLMLFQCFVVTCAVFVMY